MDYSDKIARYQEIERRGLLDQLPIEKQEAWAEYKRRQTPELNLTDEQKAKIQATNDEYARRQAERDSDQWFVSLVENQQDDPLKKFARSTARLGLSGMQGIANAGLNPFSESAKAMGADLKPIKPETSAERMAELAGEYGYDAAVLRALGGIAEGAGFLGEGISGASRVAKAVLAPEGGLKSFVAPAVGSAFVRGYTDPRNPFEGFLADVAGAASVGGLQSALAKDTKQVAGGLKNLLKNDDVNAVVSKGIKGSKEVAQQVADDAPRAYNQLNAEMENALEKATGRQINVGRALENQQERMNEYIGRNADYPVYNSLSPEQQTQQNFKRWFEGSKVVDENGQPRRYYHGSLRNFDKFKQGNNDYNFSPDEKFAYNYAENKAFEQGIDAEPKVYEVFLKSKKPFDFENPKDIQNLSDYIGNKAIKVFGNPKEKNDFLSNLKGEYYDTDLRKGEFEKLFDENAFYPYNWYDGTNKIVDQTYSSMSDSRIFKVNPNEEYFIAGSLPYGYDIRDINKKQVEDAIKNLDFNKFKKQQIPVDIQTEYGNRVVNLDLKRIDKPSIKNLKKGGDNWVTIESADFDGEDLLDALKNMGYDGYYKQENGVKNLSVFNPNQIKSVNNSGAWSSSPSLSDAGWKPQAGLEQFTQGLDEFQMKALNTALEKGKQMSTHERGSLGATHRAQEVLNDMINASYDTSVIGRKEPTTETRELMKVKERLNHILESSGIKEYDASLAKAKSLKSFKEMGYKFKPSETKFENLGLEKLRDKKAFLQGYEQQIKDNVLSDGGTNLAAQIKKGENVFEKLLPKKQFDSLMKKAGELDTDFKRLKSLEGQANRELVKQIERNGSSFRENSDAGKLSWIGRMADIAEGALKRRGNVRLAKQYLNPNTTQITTRGGLKEALKGIGTASTRQTIFDLLSNGD